VSFDYKDYTDYCEKEDNIKDKDFDVLDSVNRPTNEDDDVDSDWDIVSN
jgi:hypothetical protein